MDLKHLLLPHAPWFQVLVADATEVADAAAALDTAAGIAARVVRGRKMQRAAALFDEVAAALQFPPYFGENWDALDECLADLAWLRADAVLLIILDAVKVLDRDSSQARQIFWQTLERIAQERAVTVSEQPSGPAKVFRVALQCSVEEENQLRVSLARPATH